MTDVEARNGNLLHVATDHQQQATHRQYNFRSRFEVTPGKGHA